MIFFWPPIILALRHDFKALVPAFPGCLSPRSQASEPPNEQLQLGISVETGLTTTRSFAPFYGLAQVFVDGSLESSTPSTPTCGFGMFTGDSVPWSSSLGQPGLTTTDHTTPACFAAHVPSQAAVVHHRRLLFIVPTEVSRIKQERPLRLFAANVASILQNKTRRHGWYIRECVPHE
jgi:hypothetical protein